MKGFLDFIAFCNPLFPGISAFLKSVKPDVKVWLIDPAGSTLFSYVKTGKLAAEGSSFIEGIGIGRITANFKQAKLDDAVRGSDRCVVVRGLKAGKAARRGMPLPLGWLWLCDQRHRHSSLCCVLLADAWVVCVGIVLPGKRWR